MLPGNGAEMLAALGASLLHCLADAPGGIKPPTWLQPRLTMES